MGAGIQERSRNTCTVRCPSPSLETRNTVPPSVRYTLLSSTPPGYADGASGDNRDPARVPTAYGSGVRRYSKWFPSGTTQIPPHRKPASSSAATSLGSCEGSTPRKFPARFRSNAIPHEW